jgi:hypothetical protein
MTVRSCHKEPDLDDHTIIASDENFGNVTVCPGGVVHVNLVHVSLKFTPDDFSRFAELIARARLNSQHQHVPRSKPRLQVVTPDTSEGETPEVDT